MSAGCRPDAAAIDDQHVDQQPVLIDAELVLRVLRIGTGQAIFKPVALFLGYSAPPCASNSIGLLGLDDGLLEFANSQMPTLLGRQHARRQI